MFFDPLFPLIFQTHNADLKDDDDDEKENNHKTNTIRSILNLSHK
jgi:hypothetical protein